MDNEKPWWWPELVDSSYFSRLRKDYPEECEGKDDYALREYFDAPGKYVDCWDHLGDARADWEKLSDAFLKLVSAAQDIIDGWDSGQDFFMDLDFDDLREALDYSTE